MSRYYHRRFRVRGYEVSASGRVHDSAYLNYIQQAAFEASSDAGYDTRRYDALGTIWVIRKQAIVYLAPLSYDDTVDLTTWVSDVRRVRSQREYEMRRGSDGQLVAVAYADWVYIDTATLFPRRITADVIDAFQPNGRVALDAAVSLEPSQGVRGGAFVYQHRVKSYELDNLRHVNNANYLNWLFQARLDALAQGGFPVDTESSLIAGLDASICPVRYEIEYFVPAVAEDRVEVHSQVTAAGKSQLTWNHRVTRGQERLVEARAIVGFEAADSAVLPLTSTLLDALVL